MVKVVQSKAGRVVVYICRKSGAGFDDQSARVRQIVARQYVAFQSWSAVSILKLLVVSDKHVVRGVFSFFSP